MLTHRKIEDCHDTMFVAMTEYIDQLKADNAFLERENGRLALLLEDARNKLAANQGGVLAQALRSTPQEWANAYGYSLSDSVARAQLDSDKDPFEEGKPNE